MPKVKCWEKKQFSFPILIIGLYPAIDLHM